MRRLLESNDADLVVQYEGDDLLRRRDGVVTVGDDPFWRPFFAPLQTATS